MAALRTAASIDQEAGSEETLRSEKLVRVYGVDLPGNLILVFTAILYTMFKCARLR